jgi:hypothetical protein
MTAITKHLVQNCDGVTYFQYYDPFTDAYLPVQPITNNDVSLATLVAQGAQTTASSDQVNTIGRGLHLTIDVTAITGTTPTITVTVQGKDVASGKYYTILASAAISTVSTTVLRVYPGLTAAANLVASDIMPKTWRISYTIAGTTPSVTATIGACIVGV